MVRKNKVLLLVLKNSRFLSMRASHHKMCVSNVKRNLSNARWSLCQMTDNYLQASWTTRSMDLNSMVTLKNKVNKLKIRFLQKMSQFLLVHFWLLLKILINWWCGGFWLKLRSCSQWKRQFRVFKWLKRRLMSWGSSLLRIESF